MEGRPKGAELLRADTDWALSRFQVPENRQAYMELLTFLTADRAAPKALQINTQAFRKMALQVPELPSAMRTASLALDVSAAVFSHVVVTSEFIYPAMRDWMMAQEALLVTMRAVLANLDGAPPTVFAEVVMEFLNVVRGFEEATFVYSLVARMLAGDVTPPPGLQGRITQAPLNVEAMTDELYRFCTNEAMFMKVEQLSTHLRDRFHFGKPLRIPSGVMLSAASATGHTTVAGAKRLGSATKSVLSGVLGFGVAWSDCVTGRTPPEKASAACAELRANMAASAQTEARVKETTIAVKQQGVEMGSLAAGAVAGAAATALLPIATGTAVAAGTVGLISGLTSGGASLVGNAMAEGTSDKTGPGAWAWLKDNAQKVQGGMAAVSCRTIGFGCDKSAEIAADLAATQMMVPAALRLSGTVQSWTLLPLVNYLSCFVPGSNMTNEEMREYMNTKTDATATMKADEVDVRQLAFKESSTDLDISRASRNGLRALMYASKGRCELLTTKVLPWVSATAVYYRDQVAALFMGAWQQLSGIFTTFQSFLSSAFVSLLSAPAAAVGWLTTQFIAFFTSVTTATVGLGGAVTTASIASGAQILAMIAVYGPLALIVSFLLYKTLGPVLRRLIPGVRDLMEGVPVWRRPGYLENITGRMQAAVRKDGNALRQALADDLAAAPLELRDIKLMLATVENAIMTATQKREPDLSELVALHKRLRAELQPRA
jgi:hypothetical protein